MGLNRNKPRRRKFIMTETASNFLFSGKVYCGLCNWKYRAKKNETKKCMSALTILLDTGKNGCCEHHKVDEQHHVSLKEWQFSIYGLPGDTSRGFQVKIFHRYFAPFFIWKYFEPHLGQIW